MPCPQSLSISAFHVAVGKGHADQVSLLGIPYSAPLHGKIYNVSLPSYRGIVRLRPTGQMWETDRRNFMTCFAPSVPVAVPSGPCGLTVF